MMPNLSSLDPQFRQLTDLFWFTDRMDVDWSDYYNLLISQPNHEVYLFDRYYKSLDIFWGVDFWAHRLDVLYSFPDKSYFTFVAKNIKSHFQAITRMYVADFAVDNSCIQFLGLCKVYVKHRTDLIEVRKFLLNVQYHLSKDKLLELISQFIPTIFPDLNSYADAISKDLARSSTPFQILDRLEQQGIPVSRQHVFKLAKDLFFDRVPNRKNRSTLFNMLDNPQVMAIIKQEYQPPHRDRLLHIIKQCDYKEIEQLHLRNVKNLLEIDVSVADEVMVIYADSLYKRRFGHKKANVDRLIRLLKTFPQCSPKEVLVYLSNHGKMSDVKHLFRAFPELKTLAPFI